MSERSEYAPGEFCWVDLSTPDTEAATSFYGELLGWEAQPAGPVEETGGYGFFLSGGRQVAGYGPTPEGAPPAWLSHVKVADADAAAQRVADAGGTVMFPPMDLPAESGRMAVVADSEGAVFSLMQQNRHTGAQFVNEPGSWTWNQLATRDIDAARDFYGKVLGWRIDQSENATPDVPYFMWQVDGQRWPEGLAGAMVMGSDMAGVPPHWAVYLAVDDADGTVETVKRRGGQVLFGPIDIPVGRFAAFIDPQGAAFSAIEPHYEDPR